MTFAWLLFCRHDVNGIRFDCIISNRVKSLSNSFYGAIECKLLLSFAYICVWVVAIKCLYCLQTFVCVCLRVATIIYLAWMCVHWTTKSLPLNCFEGIEQTWKAKTNFRATTIFFSLVNENVDSWDLRELYLYNGKLPKMWITKRMSNETTTTTTIIKRKFNWENSEVICQSIISDLVYSEWHFLLLFGYSN